MKKEFSGRTYIIGLMLYLSTTALTKEIGYSAFNRAFHKNTIIYCKKISGMSPMKLKRPFWIMIGREM